MSDEQEGKPPADAPNAVARVPDAVEPKVDIMADLLEQEIRNRLRLVNPDLVDEVYGLAKAQVESERARHVMLNSKAASVLTSSGISLTVSLTLAGPLLANKVVLSTTWSFAFLLAGSLGLASIYWAVLSLRVIGGFPYVNDHAVFDRNILNFADSPPGCEDLADLKEKYAFGAAAYKQHMAAHLWAVATQEHRQLDRKAKQVQAAQWLFLAFAVLISTCGGNLFLVISSQNKDAREAAAAKSAAAEGAQRRQGLAATPAAQVAPDAGQASQPSIASSARLQTRVAVPAQPARQSVAQPAPPKPKK
jgi:hypothetical protein